METTKTVLQLDSISKRFGSRAVIKEISFDVREGERFFIVGPSGCGKTTILRIVAGLAGSHGGGVTIDGRPVAGAGTFMPPHRRNVGFVFQDGALWPHLTVEKHLYFAKGARENREWTEKILALTGLAHRRTDFPHMLSGGERQRISLARALSGRPRLLLLDEPLRNLDGNLAKEMRAAIIEILDKVKTTAIFVTHDQEEALSMAHRILLLDREGPVQLGTPDEIYNQPATPWAAGFFGQINTFNGRTDDKGALATPLGPVPTGLDGGVECAVLFRPTRLTATAGDEKNGGNGGRAATVRGKSFIGDTILLSCDVEGYCLTASWNGPAPATGDTVFLAATGAPFVFPAATPCGTSCAGGSP
jgi:iron(III) transport system ATP-binding protein